MTKTLNYINFALLLALGGICLAQWAKEREYNRKISSLQRATAGQEEIIKGQASAIKRASDDLKDFKSQISISKSLADERDSTIRTNRGYIFQLEQLRDRQSGQIAAWQKSVADYKLALTNRDDDIKELLRQREQLAAANKDAATKANQAVGAYNELAVKYQDVVERYNKLARQAQGQTQVGNVPEK